MTALPYNKEVITGEDMRESLKKLVSTKLFWGKAAVNKMLVEDVALVGHCGCRWRRGHVTIVLGRHTWRNENTNGRAVLSAVGLLGFVNEIIDRSIVVTMVNLLSPGMFLCSHLRCLKKGPLRLLFLIQSMSNPVPVVPVMVALNVRSVVDVDARLVSCVMEEDMNFEKKECIVIIVMVRVVSAVRNVREMEWSVVLLVREQEM